MYNDTELKQLLSEELKSRNLFLVNLKISPSNKILILVDSLAGVTIDQCVGISRFVESNLDREKEDYELEVSSPGLDEPLKIKVQYEKNIGRELQIVTNDDVEYKGRLIAVENEAIRIETVNKVKKSGSKKKSIEKEEHIIDFINIKLAKVVITFR
ncbi:MAG: ribosome assembly cofactor RimP [Bacteroidales bacterium]|nr:ribosome assembly cofactor RimP [Bacteroidales bacterium]